MIKYANIVANITTLRDQAQNILEIGSRDGHDAEKLRKAFKINSKRVYLVEANPDQIPKIEKNYPNVNVFNFAISNHKGEATFNKVLSSEHEIRIGTSSLMDRPKFYADKVEMIKVPTFTGKDLLDKIHEEEIDLCKIDVEGHTFEVLEGFGDDLQRIKTMHIECEHVQKWKGQKIYEENRSFLENKGFTQIFFMYVWGGIVQSDSVWARNDILKGAKSLAAGYTGY